MQTVELGATLTGSSEDKISQIRGVSVRPLTTLGPGSLGKAAHRHFAEPFYNAGLIYTTPANLFIINGESESYMQSL